MSTRSKPIFNGESVTPSDTTNLPSPGRAIYVGVSGDVKLTFVGGNTVTLPNLAAGVWHFMEVEKIFATGTTATDIFVGV